MTRPTNTQVSVRVASTYHGRPVIVIVVLPGPMVLHQRALVVQQVVHVAAVGLQHHFNTQPNVHEVLCRNT